MPRWCLYYGDGSTYVGETEGDAFDAPVLPQHYGVQILKQESATARGFSLRHGCTFYCWEDYPVPRWGGHDDVFGLCQYLLTKKGSQKVLVGRELYDDLYRKICRQAVRDGCFCDGPCDHVRE